jgi:hypothetical protein
LWDACENSCSRRAPGSEQRDGPSDATDGAHRSMVPPACRAPWSESVVRSAYLPLRTWMTSLS